MHSYTELVFQSTEVMLGSLRESSDKLMGPLQESASTSLVKGLQAVQLQKSVLAVGMFSIFEARLQDGLNCNDGFAFREAGEILKHAGFSALKRRLGDMVQAINALKHGRGRSYDALVARADALPFRIKRPDEAFFEEGDVSEIQTLIEVDDAFVRTCADVIYEVVDVIRSVKPNFVV
ncbi:hypothetical protein BLA6993_06202 [Burkholderia lata]|uniref:hypothetical protein n=1 Tax=Burkholderia lata (strain ATCC 17760 / DSM 23089 / LMG 22485 / NCIMB 9086 / R18194 / 383) TaxID=482957 RepID=UPI001454978C|nr:hypothetical protein [Burkholderia lata]VWC27110.1 hypothetical protein BLA6993_06202 [Burkholderia lata]